MYVSIAIRLLQVNDGNVRGCQRLGGMLNFYHRMVA